MAKKTTRTARPPSAKTPAARPAKARRRAYEYDHQYGLTPTPPRPAPQKKR